MRPAFASRIRARTRPTPYAALPHRTAHPSNASGARLGAVKRRACALAALLALVTLLGLAPQRALAQEPVHVVARGEKLGLIAARYGTTVQEMVAANGLSDPNHIWVGQRLVVPSYGGTGGLAAAASSGSSGSSGAGYYTVGPGDTLSEIAKWNGISSAELMRLNGLTDPNFVWVGQRLRLDGSAATGAPALAQTSQGDYSGSIYVVQAGDTLSQIARNLGVTTQELMLANGLPNANFVWVGQRLRVQSNAMSAAQASAAAPAGRRWIEVNLSNQTLTAWQGDVAVLYTSISSGLAATPTVTGNFKVGVKYTSQRMTGPGYDLPGVPWVMYFYGSYAIHGAYWHNNFGVPMSRGCVNASIPDAEFLYNWAPEGTEVWVHY